MPPVPTSVLTTEDGKPGLKAEYFAGDLTGTPQVTRVDPIVDLQTFAFVPDPQAIHAPEGMKDFSVRWTGFLTPSESGTYQIGLAGSNERMWLDGKLIVDDPVLHDPNVQTASVSLTKGHRYPVKSRVPQGRVQYQDGVAARGEGSPDRSDLGRTEG